MENKNNLAIGMGITLCIFTVCVLTLIMIKKEQPVIIPPKVENTPPVLLSEDETTIYTIQNLINNYYELLINKDSKSIYSLLHDTYKTKHQLTENNLFTKLETNYENPSFIIEKFYAYEKDKLKYYFVEGYLISQEFISDETTIHENITYEFIIDTASSTYNIIPITSANLDNFIKNYNYAEITSCTGNNKYQKKSISEKNKLISYISKFKNLLLIAPEKAYNLLGDKTKTLYLTKENFISQKEEIFNKISSLIFSYSTTSNDNQNTFKIIDNNSNELTIIEKDFLNYTIDFN